MRQAASVSEFLANPIGSYFRGRRHCVFAHSPTMLGLVGWGRPDVDDIREMLALCEIGLRPGAAPHRWIADTRGLELVEPATFGLFVDYTRKNRDVLARNIIRQAQLRPDGLVGAIISGFSKIARLPYPERVFGDVDEAVDWLEIDHREGLDLCAELDAIRNGSIESDAVVVRLRAELDAAGVLSAPELAQRLGLSTRSLQRALRQAGTTFRLELKAFRMRRAQELLRGDRAISWIAAELGFSSVQHFATAYRRTVGDTPTAARARLRPSSRTSP